MDPLWILLIGMTLVVGGILVFRLHAFLALILAAMVVAGLTSAGHLQRYGEDRSMPEKEIQKLVDQSLGERVALAFGVTCGKIGILIALAAIIGKCMLESGAADRIVRSALRLFGEPRAPVALLGSSFILGVPVFFDTVFYLMIPLGKALGFRTGRNYCLYVLSIIAGATMAHSLVPPTPGPLFVASELKVDLGEMILGGLVVGIITAGAGYLYALWANGRFPIPLRDTGTESLAELEEKAKRTEKDLPPLWLALVPIVLPVLMITGGTILKAMAGAVGPGGMSGGWLELQVWMGKAGNPNIALAISAGVALVMVACRNRGREGKRPLGALVSEALSEGGGIILITCAGGAFGAMLQHSGIGWRIEALAGDWNIGILPLAFFVTALVRAAQGSATVAMITSAGIVGPMVVGNDFGFHVVYVALAIGCGSKPFPWMNDSGFWVIGRMSGMTVPETLKTFSVMLTLMGLVGLAAVMLLAKLFPMV